MSTISIYTTAIFSLVTYMGLLHPDWSREQVEAAVEARLQERMDVMRRTIHTVFIGTIGPDGERAHVSPLGLAQLRHPDHTDEQLIADAEWHLAWMRDYEMRSGEEEEEFRRRFSKCSQ